jgi:predicted ABC-class ATPase
MPSGDQLRSQLLRIDGRGYKAYRDIEGEYRFPSFTLHIDHVQGDPFAAPSRVRVRVPQSVASYPPDTFSDRSRNVALANFLTLQFSARARAAVERRGAGKSGLIEIDRPGQEMLERTSVVVTPQYVEARFAVGLPARGRRILGRHAAEMLLEDIPAIAEGSLLYRANDPKSLYRYATTCEDADSLRASLRDSNLVAFVADSAVLPRRSGVDDRPLQEGIVVPFQSPESLRMDFHLPNAGAVTGMGIPEGVTLIVGGGYHGKSTLLSALERGIYNHRPGDGRELVVADPDAVKIRAEDGRRVEGVDISPFIDNLPYGQDTRHFSTENASGSTSQAANIIEAMEAGARVLLLDEDTAATNFMIRDHRMQELVAKEHEPITPFIDKVRQLHADLGVSTVLVMGGSGDYFDVADTVISMHDYLPQDVTAQARAIAQRHRAERVSEGGERFGTVAPRTPIPGSLNPSKGRRDVNVKARGLRTVLFGTEAIDLGGVEQLVDGSQTRALAQALLYARKRYMDGNTALADILDRVMADIQEKGLDVLDPRLVGTLARFRRFELAAALNRLRTLRVRARE